MTRGVGKFQSKQEGCLPEKARPVSREGSRNLMCEYYSSCLDHAIRQTWPSWTCAECSLKEISVSPDQKFHIAEGQSLIAWSCGMKNFRRRSHE